MKNTLKLCLTIIVIMLLMTIKAYAVTGNVVIDPSEVEIEQGKEFTINVSLTNIESASGVIAFGGKLIYDTEKLSLVKMEGKNTWETPTDGISYNPSNGNIAITRGSQGKGDEVIFQITFKARETGSAKISLTDVMVADGKTTPLEITNISGEMTIKESKDSNNNDADDKNDNSQDDKEKNDKEKDDNKGSGNKDSNSGSIFGNIKFPFTGAGKSNFWGLLFALITLVNLGLIVILIKIELSKSKKTK